MLIDRLLPQFVGGKAPLRQLLLDAAASFGMEAQEAQTLVQLLPSPLIDSPGFLDMSTDVWRYEFGEPFILNDQLIFGTHMFLPVNELLLATGAFARWVPLVKRAAYLAALNCPGKHPGALAEMMPVCRLPFTLAVDYEVPGYGSGSRTVDWALQAGGRLILLDAKSRTADFIQQACNAGQNGEMPAPMHDHKLMFKSIEGKFNAADPDVQLQGAWITTHIMQNRVEIDNAFAALDPAKVHFTLFGDWRSDISLLVRREADRKFLLDHFNVTQSQRFFFQP
jgi:hypothetical protein